MAATARRIIDFLVIMRPAYPLQVAFSIHARPGIGCRQATGTYGSLSRFSHIAFAAYCSMPRWPTALIVVAWTACTVLGAAVMMKYELTPGATLNAPSDWPAGTCI